MMSLWVICAEEFEEVEEDKNSSPESLSVMCEELGLPDGGGFLLRPFLPALSPLPVSPAPSHMVRLLIMPIKFADPCLHPFFRRNLITAMRRKMKV